MMVPVHTCHRIVHFSLMSVEFGRRSTWCLTDHTNVTYQQAKGRSGPVKSEEPKGGGRPKRKANSEVRGITEAAATDATDVSMDVTSDDMDVLESEGLAKRIEDTLLDEEGEGLDEPTSNTLELEPQVHTLLLTTPYSLAGYAYALLNPRVPGHSYLI